MLPESNYIVLKIMVTKSSNDKVSNDKLDHSPFRYANMIISHQKPVSNSEGK